MIFGPSLAIDWSTLYPWDFGTWVSTSFQALLVFPYIYVKYRVEFISAFPDSKPLGFEHIFNDINIWLIKI